MELLCVMGHVESRFSLFGDRVRWVHGLRQTYHRLRNHFGSSRWYSVTRLKWKLILVCLEILLIQTQDWCTVCAEHTLGSDVVLDAPDGTPR